MIVDSKSYYFDSLDEAGDFYLRLVFDSAPAKVWPPVYVVTVPKTGMVEPKWLVIVTEHAEDTAY